MERQKLYLLGTELENVNIWTGQEQYASNVSANAWISHEVHVLKGNIVWLMRKVQNVSRNEWSKKGKEIDMDLAEGLTEVFERMR